jgi:hypothetical protein
MKDKRTNLAALHPGEILRIGAGAARAGESCLRHRQRRARLARYFGTSPQLWLGLQQGYELDVARDTPAAKIEIEVLPQAS